MHTGGVFVRRERTVCTPMLVAVLLLAALLAPRAVRAGDPVDTWVIEGTLRTTACARGRCQSQAGAVRDFFVVEADGTFAFGTSSDPSCPAAVPVLVTLLSAMPRMVLPELSMMALNEAVVFVRLTCEPTVGLAPSMLALWAAGVMTEMPWMLAVASWPCSSS